MMPTSGRTRRNVDYCRASTLLGGSPATGGSTWSKDRPPSTVIQADAQQGRTRTYRYRLVDGRAIERQATGGSAWMTEHERPLSEMPRPVGDWRRDWDEQRSIATNQGPGLDAAAVAADDDGVLVRSADGSWTQS